YKTTATLAEGKVTTVTIPSLEPLPQAPVATAPPTTPAAAPIAPVRSESHWSTWTWAGAGAAIGGVAVVAVGLAFGSKASTAFDDEKTACPNLACASSSA